MERALSSQPSIVVIGLGYVGLPLAVALARHFPCTGLDINAERIAELKSGHDRTAEVDHAILHDSALVFASSAEQCPAADIYIVTVPTPIDADNRPDLSLLLAASNTVATMIDPARKPIILFESTVYPGVTEDVCGPAIERASGLTAGQDFFLAYSPERINPGDREHTIDKITKVVSGQTPEVLDNVARLYGTVTSGGVFRASSIKAAEAAKVIENAQRDINIAFMNEVTQIFSRMGLSIWDVLAAAQTKWNFMGFTPGLVGGHCIGVDPYYLSHRAEKLGHDPRVILSGRGINDAMPDWIVDRLHAARDNRAGSVLMLGLTFKENVPDLRNSKVAELVRGLTERGHNVTVHDPLADAAEALHEYGLTLNADPFNHHYDLVILAVPHREYLDMGHQQLAALVADKGMFADIKNGLGASDATFPCRLWRL